MIFANIFSIVIWLTIFYSDIRLFSFKKLGGKIKLFFADVDSILCLFSKFSNYYKTRIKKKKFKFRLILFALIVSGTNFLILLFASKKISAINPVLNLFSNLPELALTIYLLLYASIGVFSLTFLYLFQFTSEMTFLEDNYKRVRVLIVVFMVPIAFFLLSLNITLILGSQDFTLLLGFISPFFLGLMIKPSKELAKIYAKEERITSETFFDGGAYLTNWKTIHQAIEANVRTRDKWRKEVVTSKQKERVREVIIHKLEQETNNQAQIEIQTPASRIAELANIPVETTDKILQQLHEEVPELGTYYPISRVYVKNRKLTTEKKVLKEKIVPDKYDTKEKKVEMKESTQEKLSVSERFQEMYDEIVGETEEEKKKTLEYANKLTEKEAEVYLNFIKRGKGVKSVVLTNAEREFLQRAWKKIHVQEDIFQRNSSTNLLRGFYDEISDAHNGFDDIVFEMKEKGLFKITFLDYKIGDHATYYPWEYVPKFGYHLKRRELNKKQLFQYLTQTPIIESLFPIPSYLGKKEVPLFIKKLFNDRNRQYHLIGNDWLIKFFNGDFLNALSYLISQGMLSVKQKRQIVKGISEFSRLVGLAQNGHAIRFSDNSKKTHLESNVKITVQGKQIDISHDFFLPSFQIKQGKIMLSLNGFKEVTDPVHKHLNLLINHNQFSQDESINKILIRYASLKREFILSLLNSELLDLLSILYGGRCHLGLDTITSSDFLSKMDRLDEQPVNQRGISYFYDVVQVITFDFLTNKKLKEILGEKEKNSLFSKLASLLTNFEVFLEDEDDPFTLATEIYQSEGFDFFLLNQDTEEIYKPPTYSFRRDTKPKTGVLLIDNNNRVVDLISSSKTVGIQLEDDDILLNFPFRWDSNYRYFSFTQKGNTMSKISKSWYNWLKTNNLPIPSGSSGKIPSISIIMMFLEWWKRQEDFVITRILSDEAFIEACSKKEIAVDEISTLLLDKRNNSYKLARVTVTQTGLIRHKEDWKYYPFYNYKIRNIIDILNASIYDLILQKNKTSCTKISDLRRWLEENWLREFELMKNYFF
ncbi:MAG: hypothetical protein GOP50_08015 [Candidatus Heimdallarchaeota archaeon]|nr:hypothetical protein [Candidatus Heimdallarchaeota archaeon]